MRLIRRPGKVVTRRDRQPLVINSRHPTSAGSICAESCRIIVAMQNKQGLRGRALDNAAGK